MSINREELVQRSKYGLRRAIFSRTGLVLLLFLVQAGLLVSVMVWFQEWQAQVVGASAALTMISVLVVLNSDLDPTAKLTWMVVMTVLPVFGALFYWYTRRDMGHRLLREIMTERQVQSRRQIDQDPKVLKALEEQEPGAAGMARYVRRSGCFPVFDGTAVTYFPWGKDMFEKLLQELEAAEKFIFGITVSPLSRHFLSSRRNFPLVHAPLRAISGWVANSSPSFTSRTMVFIPCFGALSIM